MPYGINQNIYEQLIEIFKEYPKIIEVILFGSRITNDFKDNSDIDLCIKHSNGLDTILNLMTIIEELPILNKFDLINYQTLTNPLLKKNIDLGKII